MSQHEATMGNGVQAARHNEAQIMPKTTPKDDNAAGFHLLLTLDKPALAAGGATTLRALVRIQAPDLPADAKPRPPLHLALVLDRSGSMSGAPLEEAKRCARNIVDSLAPGDRAAIFAFDDEVRAGRAADAGRRQAGADHGAGLHRHRRHDQPARRLARRRRRTRRQARRTGPAPRGAALRRLRQRGRDGSGADRDAVQGAGRAGRVDVDLRAGPQFQRSS